MSGEKRDISSMNPEELQGAVQSILQDPAFGRILGELTGGRTAENTEPAEAVPQTPTVPQITPEMMARLPQMMAALSPLIGGKTGGGESGQKKPADDAEKRKRLLAALKPYLSGSRREAVDSIMKVTEMTDLIGQMGIGSPGTRDSRK